jgi:hypothetical protein
LRSFTFILLNNSEIIPAVLNVLYNTGIHVGPKIKHSSHQVSYNRKPNGQLRINNSETLTTLVIQDAGRSETLTTLVIQDAGRSETLTTLVIQNAGQIQTKHKNTTQYKKQKR